MSAKCHKKCAKICLILCFRDTNQIIWMNKFFVFKLLELVDYMKTELREDLVIKIMYILDSDLVW